MTMQEINRQITEAQAALKRAEEAAAFRRRDYEAAAGHLDDAKALAAWAAAELRAFARIREDAHASSTPRGPRKRQENWQPDPELERARGMTSDRAELLRRWHAGQTGWGNEGRGR